MVPSISSSTVRKADGNKILQELLIGIPTGIFYLAFEKKKSASCLAKRFGHGGNFSRFFDVIHSRAFSRETNILKFKV